jgi:hypothetical protein
MSERLTKTQYTTIKCNLCKDNIAKIFQESGEFCLYCWQERTYPSV